MLQPRISAIETVGGNLRLDTLQRIAAAFDIALVVRFVPFSELVRWSDTFSPDDFTVPDFASDPMFSDQKPTNKIVSLIGYVDSTVLRANTENVNSTRYDYNPASKTTRTIDAVDEGATAAAYSAIAA